MCLHRAAGAVGAEELAPAGFATIWIPGVKLKAVDLGVARLQRCPVGHHSTIVLPVKPASLTDEERRQAVTHRDVRLP
ncbi:MAG: hypothetical protein ACYCU7_05885 [Acidimicrobiales bacterium]